MSVSILPSSSNSMPNSGGSSPVSHEPSTAPTSPKSPDPNFGFPNPAPANIMPCDDAGHCQGGWFGQCEIANLRTCRGLPDGRTLLSYHGNIDHPHPIDSVVTCRNCRSHDDHPTLNGMPKVVALTRQSIGIPFMGPRAQLCHSCIRDEMELYWQRQNINPPPNPALSVHIVKRWPNNQIQDQDLCICEDYAITPFVERCHACRDEIFLSRCWRLYRRAERILYFHTKPVVTGEKRCLLNGGTSRHEVPARLRSQRWMTDKGRKCPCGNVAKAPLPIGQEYITFCLACMGVQVTPANLPAKYQQANMQPRRRSPRGHAMKRTLGPMAAERSAQFRVNIERGWVQNDWLVGGR